MDAPMGNLDAGRLAVARPVANQLPYLEIVHQTEAANQVVAAGAQT